MNSMRVVFFGKNTMILTILKTTYCSICNGHAVDVDGTWINGDWFYTTT